MHLRAWARLAIVALLVSLWPATGAVANSTSARQVPDARSADWLRTVRDTPLWSGPSDPAVQFTLLPLGSLVQPKGGDLNRTLIYYPGDGRTRQAGLAWVATDDIAPSGPPPWIALSDLDGDTAPPQPAPGAPTRVVPVAPPRVTAAQVA